MARTTSGYKARFKSGQVIEVEIVELETPLNFAVKKSALKVMVPHVITPV